MVSFYDKLEDSLGNYEELTNLLINFDNMLEYLHNNGLCIYDFNIKKVIMYNDKLTLASFNGLINDIGESPNMKSLNIYQLAKIGLMAYNNQIVDGRMNQEHFDFIRDNLPEFNINGNIPDEVFEYYGEIFERLDVTYLNDYLVTKQMENAGNQNANIMKKTLSTSIGRAYASDESDNAFVNILFIPSIITFLYLIGLIVYFVLK
ncbi:MAG: hypothetical protein IJ068_03125 [Bacilli bacterium]|nr:hypothetical protein [Bacilli bacterium]